jgi:F1F0 ATPase subunit 2
MKENEIIKLLYALATGALTGIIFFGGLWWTVKKGTRSSRPALWFATSFLVRTTLAVTGFYFASNGHWQTLMSCLAGFLIARIFVIRFVGEHPAKSTTKIKGGTA